MLNKYTFKHVKSYVLDSKLLYPDKIAVQMINYKLLNQNQF